MSGTLGDVQLPSGLTDLEVLWDDAVLALPLTDARSVREPILIRIGDLESELGPGGVRVPGFGEQLVAPLVAFGPEALAASRAFSLSVALAGTTGLQYLPLGDSTRVALAADWPSPSFKGAYLPAERAVDSTGFKATWTMLSLGRGFPSQWSRSERAGAHVGAAAFGVSLIERRAAEA